MSHPIKKIVIIGTGNVATHLGQALKESGYKISQLYGRTQKETIQLAKLVDCIYTTRIEELINDADLYILAVTENAITEVLEQIPLPNNFIVHTAGSVSIDVLKPYSKNYGVLYPLQTFSKKDMMNYSDIPFCIEANSQENLETLIAVAGSISKDVRNINSDQRKLIHLAAVFACNFPNLLYAIAEEILKNEGIGFDIIMPLIERTFSKLHQASPSDVQTGPAQREDLQTIKNHLALLENEPGYKEIYKLLSEAIIKNK